MAAASKSFYAISYSLKAKPTAKNCIPAFHSTSISTRVRGDQTHRDGANKLPTCQDKGTRCALPT